MKKYDGIMKELWRKKYVGNMKIRTLPIYGLWDLEKFQDHPFISRGGGSQFPGLGVPQREDMKHVNIEEYEEIWRKNRKIMTEYVEIMKKYEEICGKYEGIPLLYILLDLEKFPLAHYIASGT